MAAVPDAQAYACFTPSFSANCSWKVFTNLPLVLVRVPEVITSFRLLSSSAPNVRPDESWSDGSWIIVLARVVAKLSLVLAFCGCGCGWAAIGKVFFGLSQPAIGSRDKDVPEALARLSFSMFPGRALPGSWGIRRY